MANVPPPDDWVPWNQGAFDNIAQRGAFKAHPLYKRVVEIVNETRDVRIAVDFIGGGD